MYRFFSFAIIFNWIAVLALLGIVGFGFENGSGGMVGALEQALSGEAGLQMPANVSSSLVAGAVLITMTAMLWALFAVIFAAPNGSEDGQQNLVVMFGMGVCLCVFAAVLVLAIYTGTTILGSTVCVASFATILAGIAHRVFVIEALDRKAGDVREAGFNVSRAPMYSSAKPVMSSTYASRFVPKNKIQPNNSPNNSMGAS